MVSVFNQRFTILVNEMDEKSLSKKYSKIENATGIPVKTLRKYYISENAPETSDNRINTPALDTIRELATFFNVSILYLIGESDFRTLIEERSYQSNKEFGLSPDMIRAIKQIQDLPDKKPYFYALDYLLTEYISKEHDADTKPYNLLYLLGKYFSAIQYKFTANVLPDVEAKLTALTSRENLTTNTIKSELSQIKGSIEYRYDTAIPEYFNAVVEELKSIRENIDEMQAALFSTLAEGDSSSVGNLDYEIKSKQK